MPIDRQQHYHFLGIGGVGMSALAHVLHARGIQVSGSDARDGETLHALAAVGVPVFVGHEAQHLDGVDVVVYTSAMPKQHAIWQAVAARGLPRLHRAQLLAALATEADTVAIAGTHGKTTCTGALAWALIQCGADPSVLVGGHLPQWEGRNYRAGKGRWLVCEADESDGSFLHLRPSRLLLTNVEADHLDFHGSLENLLGVFRTLLETLPPDSQVIYCADDPTASQLVAAAGVRARSYGLAAHADVRVEMGGAAVVASATVPAGRTVLTLIDGGQRHTLVTPLLGAHNAVNLCGVFALACSLKMPTEALLEALGEFRGVARRQQYLGTIEGAAGSSGAVQLYDDYAHHPTEVAATLNAFRAAAPATVAAPLTVVFQPHLYSRTVHFADQFAQALALADRVYVCEIYGAREAPVPGVSSRMIVERLRRLGHPQAYFLEHWRDAEARVRSGEIGGGTLLSMGAGDVTGLGPLLLQRLPSAAANPTAASTAAANTAPAPEATAAPGAETAAEDEP